MSKAEDLSRKYVFPFLDKQYEKYGEYKQMELSRFDGYDMMSSYEEGYYQAEKDNKLTWEDIQKIDVLIYAVLDEEKYKRYYTQDRDGNFYKEVLKRFKDFRERKEK